MGRKRQRAETKGTTQNGTTRRTSPRRNGQEEQAELEGRRRKENRAIQGYCVKAVEIWTVVEFLVVGKGGCGVGDG